MKTRMRYSQNFLKNVGLIHSILSKSSITQQDTVLEVGAGEGIITKELLGKVKKVIAYEVDNNLSKKLVERFRIFENKLELFGENFLSAQLPAFPYKVFSNIPFNITADVTKKLVFSNHPPEDIYLVVQEEAAAKFLGKPLNEKNSLMSVIIGNTFEGSVFHSFRQTDFFPAPAVSTVMLRLKRLERSRIQPKDLFNDFVAFGFSQFEPNIQKGLGKIMNENIVSRVAKENRFRTSYVPSQLDRYHWIALFTKFLEDGNKQKVIGSFQRLLDQQSKLQKVHRTRLDKNWKQFR